MKQEKKKKKMTRSEWKQDSDMVWLTALPLEGRVTGAPCPAPPTPCLWGTEAPWGPQGHQTIAGLLQGMAAQAARPSWINTLCSQTGLGRSSTG